MLLTHVDENTYKDEILDIFTYIVENSRRIQAKTLFTHNILLIGFMGAGKTTISDYLSTMKRSLRRKECLLIRFLRNMEKHISETVRLTF